VAKAGGLTMPQLAVAYIRDLPGVTSLVLGCEKAEQVIDNANLINTRPLTAAEMDAIAEIGRKAPIEKTMEIIRSAKWDPKTGRAK
jgi:aryl-alcohol dehydrogenase-like predicted oxidoreductase